MPKSHTITLYRDRNSRDGLTQEQVAFADEVYALCEANYANGGDTVVETMTPREICEKFKTLEDAKTYCGLHVEQATNARWGEDTDPELDRERRFREWDDGKK